MRYEDTSDGIDRNWRPFVSGQYVCIYTFCKSFRQVDPPPLSRTCHCQRYRKRPKSAVDSTPELNNSHRLQVLPIPLLDPLGLLTHHEGDRTSHSAMPTDHSGQQKTVAATSTATPTGGVANVRNQFSLNHWKQQGPKQEPWNPLTMARGGDQTPKTRKPKI